MFTAKEKSRLLPKRVLIAVSVTLRKHYGSLIAMAAAFPLSQGSVGQQFQRGYAFEASSADLYASKTIEQTR